MGRAQPGSGAQEFGRSALSEADMATAVAYVDGALGHDERLAFELRLAAEPALAAATGALRDTDRLLRTLEMQMRTLEMQSANQVARARRLRPLLWAGSLALAATVLIAVGVSLLDPGQFDPGERKAGYRVAVAPGYESSADYIASVPSLGGLRPPGLDVLRGADETPNVSAREFADRAHAAELELARTVLDQAAGAATPSGSSTQGEISAGFFVVPLELAVRSDVVVYALAEQADPARASEGAAPVFFATLEAGRHVLPKERVALDAVTGDSVRYERGFLVSLGAGVLDVVVGVRASSDAPLVVSKAGDKQQAVLELERAGFSVRVLRVREPAD